MFLHQIRVLWLGTGAGVGATVLVAVAGALVLVAESVTTMSLAGLTETVALPVPLACLFGISLSTLGLSRDMMCSFSLGFIRRKVLFRSLSFCSHRKFNESNIQVFLGLTWFLRFFTFSKFCLLLEEGKRPKGFGRMTFLPLSG